MISNSGHDSSSTPISTGSTHRSLPSASSRIRRPRGRPSSTSRKHLGCYNEKAPRWVADAVARRSTTCSAGDPCGNLPDAVRTPLIAARLLHRVPTIVWSEEGWHVVEDYAV